MSPSWLRPTRALVDPAAIRHNVAEVARLVAPAAVLVAVKADGYGHGALTAARAAIEGGATWLGVATVDEGAELRSAGLDAAVLVLAGITERPALDAAVGAGLQVCVDGDDAIDALESTADHLGVVADAHLVIDTGMHRFGGQPSDAPRLAARLAASGSTRLVGTATHFVRADEPGAGTTAGQLGAFESAVAAIREAGVDPGLLHAANSAGALDRPAARFDLVRIGISAYGISPLGSSPCPVPLRPAMRIETRVTALRWVPAGDGVSYGHRYRSPDGEWVATLPIGYADGVRRDSGGRGVEVLIGGVRRPIRGAVTMDQVMVGVDDTVAVGDAAVLIGTQGGQSISAAEVAERLDTIAYEVLTSVGSRVPRVTVSP